MRMLGSHVVLHFWPCLGVKGVNVVQVFIDEIPLDTCGLNNVVVVANEG
jgi:hypothetical protein